MSAHLTLPDAGESALEAEAVLAAHGRSFHFASRFLDPVRAERAARLYRFCRHVDDVVDEADDRVAASLELDRIVAAITSGRSNDLIVADFLALAAECDMSMAPALELIAGVRTDLGQVRIATIAELHRYAYRVAGTVGLMMCAVLDVEDPDALPFAIDLGVAMQLTNIARDVQEDAENGRRYLPASLVGDLTPEQIAAPDAKTRTVLVRAVDWILDEAERYYRSGEEGLVYLPDGARRGIRVAARVYRRIGVRLRRRGCRTWDGRVVVPTWQKIGVAAGALVREAGPHPASRGVWHRKDLHRSLAGLEGADRIPAELAA